MEHNFSDPAAHNSTLESGLRRSQERLAALQQEHADLTDILRLISLSALERQRVLAGSRTGAMSEALKRGRESNREESMKRVQVKQAPFTDAQRVGPHCLVVGFIHL